LQLPQKVGSKIILNNACNFLILLYYLDRNLTTGDKMLITMQLFNHFKSIGHLEELYIELYSAWETRETEHLVFWLDQYYGVMLSDTQVKMLDKVVLNGRWKIAYGLTKGVA